jgi:tubulin-specific chaperone A
MARTITDEEIRLSIVINGNPAQRQLIDLERETRELTVANRDLQIEQRRLAAQGQQNTQRYRELTREIRENNTTLANNRARMNELQNQIGITGLTMAQLRQRATVLRASLVNMVPGSADFVRVQGELTAINGRLAELSGRAVTARSAIGALADGFNRYAALGASVLGALTGMVLTVQKIIDLNSELAESQAKVQKTTGMTKEEVDELTKSFGLLKTRTSRIELLGIAEVGGQLGVAKQDIGEFVEVMNKAGVALGSSFEGGTKAVAEKLGRIKGLYSELEDVSIKFAFESVGSAMNELAAAGTASEENISDFVTRIGAMPEVLKPSIQQALGLAAAFEESGLKAEIAGTNYSKVISIAAKSAGDFAKVMKMSKKEVEDLINTDPNEFFLQFADSLKGMNAVDLSKTLDSLKLNDNEVKMVLGAASKNVDLFREKIALSNKSMAEATSLTNEYNIMNNTLKATLEKVYARMAGIFTSEGFVKFLLNLVTWFAKLIGLTEDTSGRFATFRIILVNLAKVFAIVLAAMITNVTWQKLVFLWTNRNTEGTLLYNLALKAKMVAERLSIIGTQAYAAVTMLLSGNVRGAAQAIRVLSSAMATTPWGLALMGVTAIATAFYLYRENAEKLNEVQKIMNDVHLEATKNISKQKSEVDLLVKAINSESTSKERKIELLKQLNAIIPDHIGHITLENIKTAEGKKILDAYTDSLYKNARAKAVQAKFDELAQKRLETESKSSKDYETVGDKIGRFMGQSSQPDFKTKKEVENYVRKTFKNIDKDAYNYLVKEYMDNSGLNEKEKELKTIDAQMKALEKELLNDTIKGTNKINSSDYTDTLTGVSSSSSSVTTNKDNEKQRFENERKQRMNQIKQMTAEELRLKREAEDAKLALLAEGFEKEMLQEQYNHERRIEDMTKQLISQSEINAALKKANDEKLTKEERDFFQKQADYWIKENEHRNKIIESELIQHLYRKNTIATKYDTERIKKLDEQYTREKTLREAAYQEELAGKNYTEEQLKTAREEFDKAEVEQYKNHVNNVIAELQKLIAVKQLALQQSIVPEESAVYQQQIESLQALIDKMNELAAAKNNVKSGGGGEGAFGGNDLLSAMGGVTDIFGFSPDHWEKMFENLEAGKIGVGEIATAVSALANVWGGYNKIVSANEQRQLKSYQETIDKRKKTLKMALDNGWITQKEYNDRVEKMEEDLEKKKAKMEYDAAVRERDLAIINSIINTAVGVTKVIDKPWLAVAVGLAGAFQTAMIAQQEIPSPGFEQGYYPVKREQDGKVFNAKRGGIAKSGMVKRPTHFLAGENGQFFPEMIIDGKSFKNFSPQLKENLYNELNGIRGYERGYIDNRLGDNRPVDNRQGDNPNIDNGNSNIALEMLIKENIAILKEIKEEGILAVVSDKDFLSIDKLNKAQDRLRKIKEKSTVVG